MARQGLVTDLEILDYLELFDSTVISAKMLNISQSSCSRRYRSFSDQFGLGFDRIADRYQPTANFDVLAGLRQAAQKLRVRQGLPRLCVGWQLGSMPLSGLSNVGVVLPIRPMSTWRLLSLLEQRLVDVALMGLLELQGLLGQPLPQLRARRVALSPMMLCLPLLGFSLRLIGHVEHPLQRQTNIDREQLSQYPSPAIPIGSAPILMASLQGHGLGSQPCGLSDYNEDLWEGFAADGVGLSYAPPFRLPALGSRYNLKSMDYDLGVREILAFVGHRDVLTDQIFPSFLSGMLEALRPPLAFQGAGVQWLT